MNPHSTKSVPSDENFPIPPNRTEHASMSAVREFAELLAEIAVQQLRQKENASLGDYQND